MRFSHRPDVFSLRPPGIACGSPARIAVAITIVICAVTLGHGTHAWAQSEDRVSSRAGNAAEEVTSVRDKLDRYIELQTKISTARNDWRIGEEMLRERIDVEIGRAHV